MFYFIKKQKDTQYKKILIKIKKELEEEKINIIENIEIFFNNRLISNYLSTPIGIIEDYLITLDEIKIKNISNKILEIGECFKELNDYKSSLKYAYLSNNIFPNELSMNLFRFSCLKLGEFILFNNLINSKINNLSSLKIKKNYNLFSIKELKYHFIKSLSLRKIDYKFLNIIMKTYLSISTNIPTFPKLYTKRPIYIFPSLTMQYNQLSSQIRNLTNEGNKIECILIFFDSLNPNIDKISYIFNLQLVLLLKLLFPSKVFILSVCLKLNEDNWRNFIIDFNLNSFISITNEVKERFVKLIYINDLFCAFAFDIRNGKSIKNHYEASKFVYYINVPFYVYPWFEIKDIFVGVSKPGFNEWLVENSLINLIHNHKKGFIVKTNRLL